MRWTGKVQWSKNILENVKRQDKADNTQTLNLEAWKELCCSASLPSSAVLLERLWGWVGDFWGGEPPLGIL